jgi:hypothetical protein
MFTASIAVKFVILLLQELPSRERPEPPSQPINEWYTAKESTDGLFNRTLFWWPSFLFNKGHRGILTNGDLGDMDEEFDSATLLVALTSTWANCMCQPTLAFRESVTC